MSPNSSSLDDLSLLRRISSQPTGKGSFSAEQLQQWSTPWQSSLIGKFFDKPPSVDYVRSWAEHLWLHLGFTSVLDLDQGFFVIRFQNPKQATIILTDGLWSFRASCSSTHASNPDASTNVITATPTPPTSATLALVATSISEPLVEPACGPWVQV
ncbi:hypothetical protein Cni_G29384 [Canna indica]|uniref:DUF4283 domain-containing protein n=1 Tax=Canna indica TaxID=4628 RepID=A0AAQ3QR78_9LILI|nr:hypothetical protein Cni_G29384 [Canna indica]